jgi:hypothetical protein
LNPSRYGKQRSPTKDILRILRTSSPRYEAIVHQPLKRDCPMRFAVTFPDTYLSHEIYIITENIVPIVKYSRDIIGTLASLQCEQYLNSKFLLDTRKCRSNENKSRDKTPTNSNQIANHPHLCIPPTQRQHKQNTIRCAYPLQIHTIRTKPSYHLVKIPPISLY